MAKKQAWLKNENKLKNNLLIIADDLTGAADCAIAFGRHGFVSSVRWGDTVSAEYDRTQIFSYNANSRELDAKTSATYHYELLEKLWGSEDFLFRKIDSTLRGQPAADIATTVSFLKEKTGKALGIFAPAFPATGRVTCNGHIIVDNAKLEDTELWNYDHTYPTSDMKKIMESVGIKCAILTLDHIRGGHEKLATHINELEASGFNIIVFDAEKNSDLQSIAAASLNGEISRFFIGSAGLARALVPLFEMPEHQPQLPKNKIQGSILMVVGSLSSVSRDAAKELSANRDIEYCPIHPDILLGNDDALQTYAQNIGDLLAKKRDILIDIAVTGRPNISQGARLVKTLAQSLKPYANLVSGLAATGGETANALMDTFGVNGICLFDEIEPGVSLGITTGKTEIAIATKAGAFGNRYSLLRIYDRLNANKEKDA